MNTFAIFSFITTVTNVFLAFLILKYGNIKKSSNWTLLVLNVIVAVWGGCCVMVGFSKNSLQALFWWKNALMAGVFATVVFLHHSLVVAEKKRKTILFFAYTLPIAFNFCCIANFINFKIRYIFNFYCIEPVGAGLLIFVALWSAIGLYASFILYGKLIESCGHDRTQLGFLFVALVITFFGGVSYFFTVFIPEVYPYGVLLASALPIVTTYGIVRHRILDIEVIIKKTLVFTGLLIAVFVILIIPTLLIQEYLVRNAAFTGKLIGLIISGIIIIISMKRIETFLVNITDKYLFQKKYDHKELLKTFAAEVLSILQMDRLKEITARKLIDVMKLQDCAVEVFQKPQDAALFNKAVVSGEETLAVSLVVNEEAIGMVRLGRKKSDELYSQEDLDILIPLSKALAIAISNAQLLEELGKAQTEAAQQDKMATLGTLAAGMAHEIRNPITTIRIFSEYLPDKLNEAEFIAKYKNIVVKEVDKIDHIIQTMVDFSGDSLSEAEDNVSLYEAIEELITLMGLRPESHNKVDFINRVSKNLTPIKCNRKEFDEIMINLAQNAINAIKERGSITFEAEDMGSCVRLSVTDTGCGMTEEIRKNIFSPFFTTRSKGFGLGLFVVNELVTRNNGKIFVESQVGVGTTFRLEFGKILLY